MEKLKCHIILELLWIFSFLFISFFSGIATADQITSTWQGGSGDWTDASNWDFPVGGYPDNGIDTYSAFINNTPLDIEVTLDTNVTLDALLNEETIGMTGKTITISSSSALLNSGTLDINGNVNTSYTSTINGNLINNGAINLNKYGLYYGRGNLTYTGSSISGSGAINIDDGAILTLSNNTDLDNNTVYLNNGSFRSDNGYTGGEIIGYGTLRGTLGGHTTVSGGVMSLENSISNLSSTGSMDVTGTGTFDLTDKTFTNNGTISINSGGHLTMRNSTLTNQNSGVTTIENGGVLDINGEAFTSYTSTINGSLINNGAINLNKYGLYWYSKGWKNKIVLQVGWAD